MAIRFDTKSGSYTDGKTYIKASFIRKHAKDKMGKSQSRGRLSREMLEAYWLDILGVKENAE